LSLNNRKNSGSSIKSYISESSNSRSKEKNILNSVKSQVSESGKLKANKKIYKLFVPYIKRTSVNIIDRINYEKISYVNKRKKY